MYKINKIIDYLQIFLNKENSKRMLTEGLINFDLESSENHLGDILFFAPLVNGLQHLGFDVCVNDRFSLFYDIFGINKIQISAPVIGRSFSSDIRKSFCPGGLVNFYSFESGPISRSIHNRFVEPRFYQNSLQIVKDKLFSFSMGKDFPLMSNLPDSEYFLVAPSVNSRSKGFFPNQRLNEIEFVRRLNESSEHYFAVLVGEENAVLPKSKLNLSSFVDLDLRGKTRWSDLIPLISDSRCKFVLSYDTFPYHLATLLDTDTSMLSRSWLTAFEYQWISQRFMPAF